MTTAGTLPPGTDVIAASLAPGQAGRTRVDDFLRHGSPVERDWPRERLQPPAGFGGEQ